jgi:nitrogen-specific signal transduction histidine kinase
MARTGIAANTTPERSLRLERIDALAALAGGTTHELNNIFATVLMSLTVFRGGCKDAASLALLDSVEETARRGLLVTRQMQWLARATESEPVLFQPRFLLSDLQSLFAASFPSSLLIITDYTPDLSLLRGDPLLVYQLLLALVLEAAEDLGGAGTLTLAARNQELPMAREGLAQGSYVVVEVRIEPAASDGNAPVWSAGHHAVAAEPLILATGAVVEAAPGLARGRRLYLRAAQVEKTDESS